MHPARPRTSNVTLSCLRLIKDLKWAKLKSSTRLPIKSSAQSLTSSMTVLIHRTRTLVTSGQTKNQILFAKNPLLPSRTNLRTLRWQGSNRERPTLRKRIKTWFDRCRRRNCKNKRWLKKNVERWSRGRRNSNKWSCSKQPKSSSRGSSRRKKWNSKWPKSRPRKRLQRKRKQFLHPNL